MSFLSSSPLRLALALACAAAIQIPTADAQSGRNRRGGNSDVDITVINRSDAIVNNIFVTAVDDPAWGEDRLGSDTLAAGTPQALQPRDRAAVPL